MKCEGGHEECGSICDGRGEESGVMRGEGERVKGSVRGGDRSEGRGAGENVSGQMRVRSCEGRREECVCV